MMPSDAGATTLLDAELRTPCGTVQIVRRSWAEPIDLIGEPDEHRLELAMLPRSRSARGSFPDHWGPNRFEPIGALFLFPAQHRIRTISECRRQASIVCAFRPNAVRDWFDGDLEWTDGRLRAGLDIASPAIAGLLRRLGDEITQPGFATATMAELLIAQIAIEVARHCTAVEHGVTSGGLAPWRLRRIDDRLAAGADCPSLAELAALCGLSVRHLARGFRASRGISLGRYIEADRINHARRLLRTDRPIKTIAHLLGFPSPSSFSVAFRRNTGETPRTYRQRGTHA